MLKKMYLIIKKPVFYLLILKQIIKIIIVKVFCFLSTQDLFTQPSHLELLEDFFYGYMKSRNFEQLSDISL